MVEPFHTYTVKYLRSQDLGRSLWGNVVEPLSSRPEEGATFALSYDIDRSQGSSCMEPNACAWRLENDRVHCYALGLGAPEMTALHGAAMFSVLSMPWLYDLVSEVIDRIAGATKSAVFHVVIAKSGLLILPENFASEAYVFGRENALVAYVPRPQSNHEKLWVKRRISDLEAVANAFLRFEAADQLLMAQSRICLERKASA